MAYFLKKTVNKKGTYLQIYEGRYDPERGHAVHRSYRPIGYVHALKEEGIEDPITYFRAEVRELNEKRKADEDASKRREIGDVTPERHLGYFPLKSINDALGAKRYLDIMQSPFRFQFNVYEVLSSLVYARVVDPCSKYKTFYDVLPLLYEDFGYSESQMYDALEYMGLEYEKIIEIYNHGLQKKYPVNVSTTYFDCTNFYFEIDKEDDLRRKGPSKENRRDPIVSMGLLLDANQIPIGMKIFPGNESEKPVIREVVDELKTRHNIQGRTIRVADKGLNCVENIAHTLLDNDGYIFAKSVKQMKKTEQEWVLLDQDYVSVTDEKGRVLYQYKECIDDFPYNVHFDDGTTKKVLLREKRVVTFNPSLAKKKKAEILRQVDKAKRLTLSAAKKKEYGDSAKYVTFKSLGKDGKATGKKVGVDLNQDAIDNDLRLVGYNCIVTSEIEMDALDIHRIYHNLWRIEESFRVMKSYLDARPVFVQKHDSIVGHFLICYLSVLLMRLFQFNILKEHASSESVIQFMRDFRVVQMSDRKWINVTKSSAFIKTLAKQTKLPLTNYFLLPSQLKSIMERRL